MTVGQNGTRRLGLRSAGAFAPADVVSEVWKNVVRGLARGDTTQTDWVQERGPRKQQEHEQEQARGPRGQQGLSFGGVAFSAA